MAFADPLTLEGRHVRLEPMTRDGAEAIATALGMAAADGAMWESKVTSIPRPEAMRAYVDAALAELDRGVSLPFVTVDRASGKAVGSTRFMNIEAPHRRLEIGTTWIGRSFQRTAINTEAKYLMLGHAFETLHCIAVDLRTHERNLQSRAAIERLGAKLDGILRNHRILPDGSLRNTASYSIIDTEWPDVKMRLEARLTEPGTRPLTNQRKGARPILDRTPIEILWTTVKRQTGPARDWHVDNLHNHERRYLADLRLITTLAPTGTILELGSAPCHMTALMKLSGYPTVGVDINPDRVASIIGQLGLDIRRCDIERSVLPFGDDSFACVMLCETFEHLRIDPAFVLSEISRVLAPGGILVVTTPNAYSLPSLGRFLMGRSIADPLEQYGKLRNIGHMGHVREYSASEVARFLEASGLAVQSVSYRYYRHPRDWKGALLRMAYRLAPRGFRRDIVIVARKTRASPRLVPLVPTVQ